MAESKIFDDDFTYIGESMWRECFNRKTRAWEYGHYSFIPDDSFLLWHITPEDMDRVRKGTIADTWQRELVERMGRIIGRRAKKKPPRCEGHF